MSAELARDYAEGASIAELAEKYGHTPRTVTRWLRKSGVAIRRPGRAPVDVNEVRALLADGKSIREAARLLGLGRGAVQARAKDRIRRAPLHDIDRWFDRMEIA